MATNVTFESGRQFSTWRLFVALFLMISCNNMDSDPTSNVDDPTPPLHIDLLDALRAHNTIDVDALKGMKL